MQSALRVGRLGPLNIHLNYTWLFAAVLILWWVALLWLPDNYPGRTTIFYWLCAVSVLVLFLLSVILHELVHTAVAGSGSRNVNLFPFGSAVPFRLSRLSPGRVIVAALAGIVFSIALGFLLTTLGGIFTGDSGFEAGLRATLTLVGWLNIALGLVNLIPGVPFDAGWALAAAIHWFTNDPDIGLRITQFIGSIATIALVLFGAWRGLTSDAWLQALALVVLGWASSEAGAIGRQRSLIRGMLDQMQVRDFMENLRPNAAVPAGATVAEMVRSHPHYPPGSPLPVIEENGTLVGVTNLNETEKLLQGTWPTTPVRSVTTPMSQVRVFSPEDTITQVLATTPSEPAVAADDDVAVDIPVVSNGKVVGSLDPNVLTAFREAGSQFGVDEVVASGPTVRGPLRALAALLPFLFILAAAAILGTMALRTDPDKLRDVIPPADEEVILSRFSPPANDLIGIDSREISVQASAPSPIISATLSIDGTPLDAQITGGETLTKTITAQMPGLTLGVHTARVTVSTENGARGSESWDFRVVPGIVDEGSPTPGGEPTSGPTPAATREPLSRLDILTYSPASGGRILAGADDAEIALEVSGPQPPVSATLFLDGEPLPVTIDPVRGSNTRYRLSADAGEVAAGLHQARLQMVGAGGGFYSSEWTFTALQADENNAYFEQTGRFVSQPFLSYWQQNGGLGLFGYPISDVITERVEGTGEVYRAQYFERARLEVHGDGDTVVLGLLGALLRDADPPAQPLPDARFFPETGHNLRGPFLAYWEANGGLAVFGFPITEELVEKNAVDGKEYTVQYFERNRFELHPDQAGTPFEVQLGLLGRQLYGRLYGP